MREESSDFPDAFSSNFFGFLVLCYLFASLPLPLRVWDLRLISDCLTDCLTVYLSI